MNKNNTIVIKSNIKNIYINIFINLFCFVMKIHTLYIDKAISLIDLAIDGLNRIKELIASSKEITDNDWMRSAAPLNELSNLINTQNIKMNYPKCSQCIFYSKGIMACMHPTNQGMRIVDAENSTCDNVALEWDEDTKQKLENSYNIN